MVFMGFSELLILLLFAGGPFSDLLGIPPGDRDGALIHAAPADSMLYLEWAERGTGTAGAPGVDGLVADPEVRHFLARLEAATRDSLARNFPADDPRRELMAALPRAVVAMSGRPGCVFATVRKDAIPEGADPSTAMLTGLRAAVIVSGGDSADEFTVTIRSWLTGLMGPNVPDKLDRLPLPLPLPVPAQLHRHGNYLILAIGAGTLDEVIERLDSREDGLATYAPFVAAHDAVKLARVGHVAWLDAKAARENLIPLLGPGAAGQAQMALNMVGLGGVNHVCSVVGVSDGQVVSRMKIGTDGKTEGLLALVAARGLQAADFAPVPADSDLVIAFSVDGQKILSAVQSMLAGQGVDQEEWQESVTEFETEFGLNVQRDIFDSFGQAVTISNSPGDGGWIATSPVLTVEVRRPAGAFKTVAKIAEYIDRQGRQAENDQGPRQRGMYLERKEFRGQRIYMLNFVGEGSPVAPSFAVTKTHLLIALHPQSLKARIRRMADTERWESFAFVPDDAGDTVSWTYVRTSEILPRIYGFVPWLAQLAFDEMQREGFHMDAFDLPSGPALLPWLGDFEAELIRTEDGFRRDTSGPPFVSGLMSAPVFMPGIFLFGVRVPQPVLEATEPADAVKLAPAEDQVDEVIIRRAP